MDWVRIGQSPDIFILNLPFSIPTSSDKSTYIYPHSDSTIVGGYQLFHGVGGGGICRELFEGKLTMPLIAGHTYQFGMWVQLFDTIYASQGDIGKIVGINSFSAYFSKMQVLGVGGSNNFPIQNYTPQVQIWQMVTDTQHWVLLQDTFIAAGGEQYVCIGNFKTDAQLQWQMVDSIRNLPTAAYYYYDDVSLIDITPNGVEEVVSKKLQLYPNPATYQLTVSSNQFTVNTIEVLDVLGRTQMVRQAHHDGDALAVDSPLQRGLGGLELNISNLTNGIYFIKATDINGNVLNGKFVKE